MKFPKYSNLEERGKLNEEMITLNDVDLPTRVKVNIKDEKEKDKFIGKVRIMIRYSLEYKELMKFLKEDRDMGRCRLMPNVDKEKYPNLKIEIHHIPFTIYEIIDTVLKYQLSQGHEPNHLRVANEVMQLHYEGIIGLIPLSSTAHQLTHNDKISIPTKLAFGDIDEFVDRYELLITDSMRNKYENSNHLDVDILEPKLLYIDDGETNMYTVEELQEMMDVKE